MITLFLSLVAFVTLRDSAEAFPWREILLPEKHIQIFFNSNPSLKEECRSAPNCPYKDHLDTDTCWGYEETCSSNHSYSAPSCPGHHKGWVSSKEEQLSTFYAQGDFGYVKQHRDQLRPFCLGDDGGDSFLECSDHLEFCRARNIMIDFRPLATRTEPVRYHMDVLKEGLIGGRCRLDKELLAANADLISPLQSWGPELRYFTEFEEKVEAKSSLCDVLIEKPTVITKIDASVNMYHHFCDFLNLYASQHVNNTGPHSFMTDTQVLIWESYPYASNFGVAWKAFTKNPIWNLDKVAGKRVCFKNLMLPLLPRIIFGLYYNTPVIWGCENSGFFHAFSHHMIHRLGVQTRSERRSKLHVTFLSRQTKHRRVLNEESLLRALRKESAFVVRKVEFTHGDSFLDQLKQDQWTDILVGMHGSGLTHLLFLPDWAVVVELYDCGDPNCYQDLARLRGIKYLTWSAKDKMTPEDKGHHPDLGAHEKFTNYSFDVDEFVKLVRRAAILVKQSQAWKDLAKVKRDRDEL